MQSKIQSQFGRSHVGSAGQYAGTVFGTGSKAFSDGTKSESRSQNVVRRMYKKAMSSVMLRYLVTVFNACTFIIFGIMTLRIIRYAWFEVPYVFTKDFKADLTDLPFEHVKFTDVLANNSGWDLVYRFYRTSSDSGQTLNLASPLLVKDPDRIFSIDTGIGVFFGIANTQSEEVSIFLAHTCSCTEKENSGHMTGYDTYGIEYTHCNKISGEVVCHIDCLLPITNIDMTEFVHFSMDNSHQNVTCAVEEYYRTKNSVGFGVTYVHQIVSKVVLTADKSQAILSTSVIGTNLLNNANERFPWQKIVIYITYSTVIYNIFCRLAIMKILFEGVKIKESTLTVLADLVGSMVTTPGLTFYTFMAFVVAGSHYYFWILSSPYDLPPEGWFHLAVQVASVGSMIFNSLAYYFDTNWVASGTFIIFFGLIAVVSDEQSIRALALDQSRGLGSILLKDCLLEARSNLGNSTRQAVIGCNVADGAGLSGIEIYVDICTGSTGKILLLAVVLEACCIGISKIVDKISKQTKTKSPAKAGSSTSLSKNKPRKVSTFETCLFFKGLLISRYCRWWSAPLETHFGHFYTISAMVENNVILWGPILVDLPYYPFLSILSHLTNQKKAVLLAIQYGFYSGVLIEDHKLMPKIENKQIIPKYVADFDFNSHRGVNPAPLK